MNLSIELAQTTCTFAEYDPLQGKVFEGRYALDTETTKIDEHHPQFVPALVMAAACDGENGYLIAREHLPAFYRAHQGVPVIFHNAAFDLAVLQTALGRGEDVYAAVDADLVWDTMLLARLHVLATRGHPARGQASLADCVERYLETTLPKDLTDAEGNSIRLGFDRFLGKPITTIPTTHLEYLGRDALATWLLFQRLNQEIRKVLNRSDTVWGYAGKDWLRSCIAKHGPLTHHIQLRSAILMDALMRNGIGIDLNRSQKKAQRLEELKQNLQEQLRKSGFLAGEKGSSKILQKKLDQFHRQHPTIPLQRTETGKQWSTAADELVEVARLDPFFRNYLDYRAIEKLLSTYAAKLNKSRHHARFQPLLATGRTSCGGGLNLQNLPRESSETSMAATVRGCFVPAPGHVFIDADYAQVELAVLAQAIQTQFRQPSQLLKLINQGQDVHRLLAAEVLGKSPEQVTREERQGVKAISFGRPGGMGAQTLAAVAKSNYGVELTEAEVESRIEAYHRMCPELDDYLRDEVDTGLELATALNLTPADYYRATCSYGSPGKPDDAQPAGWLGGMLLKVLRDAQPQTGGENPRFYSTAELDHFWNAAQQLSGWLPPDLAGQLGRREPGFALFKTVRDRLGRRPVFTLTGRLRACATFSAARNTVFQGGAADGAILGLWKVWRAGFKVVDFVHDQVVVEHPANDPEVVLGAARRVAQLMLEGMKEILPDVNVKVEVVLTQSLNKKELNTRYGEKPFEHAWDNSNGCRANWEG